MRCFFCGAGTHTTKNCPHTWSGSANRYNMCCVYCGSEKHNVKACPDTWGGNASRAWNEGEVENDFIRD